MKRILQFLQRIYYKVDPPRIPAIAFFGVYISTTVAGIVACLDLPVTLIDKFGPTIVTVFGIFIFAGSILAGIGVLPGVHWLERGGILFIMAAVVMYALMLVASTSTTIALWLVIPLLFTLLQRFFQITFGEST